MGTNWHLLMGFEVLTLCLFCNVTFASLSGHLIMDKDTVNIGVHVLNPKGLFAKEYKTWILHGDNTSKTNNFITFKNSGRTQSKLQRLPPSLQASTVTAWLQLTTMHWRNPSWMWC
jgi:hypothetical protein